MDRFESYPDTIYPHPSAHLHSNMDRFERHTVAVKKQQNVNLHSNMDRFESRVIDIMVENDENIYIPIWIDLKVQSAAPQILATEINFQKCSTVKWLF